MISVCIPTYNGGKYIREQLLSILNQLQVNDEIIISDDGSLDNTIQIINEFNDPRIRLVYNKTHVFKGGKMFEQLQHISSNIENALTYAKGDYIFLSDQDDIWMDNKVNIVIQRLTMCDLLIHDCVVIDQNENIILNSYFSKEKPKVTFKQVLIKSPFMGCCMAFKKELLFHILPFPVNIRVEHDAWIGICAIKFGHIDVTSDKLIKYRRHTSNVSSCTEKSENSLVDKVLRRIILIKAYFCK